MPERCLLQESVTFTPSPSLSSVSTVFPGLALLTLPQVHCIDHFQLHLTLCREQETSVISFPQNKTTLQDKPFAFRPRDQPSSKTCIHSSQVLNAAFLMPPK
jgi:hypothetical protein